jgi:S1-C subfamily serine protease
MSESSSRASAVASALAVVGVLGAVLVGAVWLNRTEPPSGDDLDLATARMPAANPSGPSGPSEIRAEEPVEQTIDLPEPPAADPPTRSLEDVIGAVMDAVVLVETSTARGTGFFVARDTLLTNVHVVGRNSTVTIQRANGVRAPARVDSSSLDYDLAVLKVSNSDPNHAIIPLGSAHSMRAGQEVIAIGSALGTLQNTVTRGIVSAVRQSGNATLVQTDAAINPGNSGGPLLTRDGVAIGITTMGYRDSQGLNFAVAADHARPLLEGRPAPLAPAASPAAGQAAASSPSLSPAVASDTDRARNEGMLQSDRTLTELGRLADALDEYWARFRASCYQSGRLAGTFERAWLASLDAGAMLDPVRPGCEEWITDVRSRASAIKAAVIAAEETARRAGVYPGVLRDALRKYRLQVQ